VFRISIERRAALSSFGGFVIEYSRIPRLRDQSVRISTEVRGVEIVAADNAWVPAAPQ
jgi:hypothetical protein